MVANDRLAWQLERAVSSGGGASSSAAAPASPKPARRVDWPPQPRGLDYDLSLLGELVDETMAPGGAGPQSGARPAADYGLWRGSSTPSGRRAHDNEDEQVAALGQARGLDKLGRGDRDRDEDDGLEDGANEEEEEEAEDGRGRE